MCCSRLGMTSPLCFLCGSSGRNELVSCSSCCECFHPFCVADSAPLSDSVRPDCHHWDREAMAGRIHEDGIESRCIVEKGETAMSAVINTPGAPWICLNCVVCQICSSSSGQRMVCSSCSHAYHWSCLGPAHPSSKRKRRAKWQCFACSRVEVCTTASCSFHSEHFNSSFVVFNCRKNSARYASNATQVAK